MTIQAQYQDESGSLETPELIPGNGDTPVPDPLCEMVDGFPVVAITEFEAAGSDPCLTKSYSWVAGAKQKTGRQNFGKGKARVKSVPLNQMFLSVTAKHAHAYGLPNRPPNEHGEWDITVKDRLCDSDPEWRISRSRECFQYHDGPGVIFLDHDRGENIHPPMPTLSRSELRDVIISVFPEAASAAAIAKPSSSAGIYGPEEPVPSLEASGCHLHFVAADARDIPRFAKALFIKLWLAGHGHIKITKDGKLLERTVIDAAVFQPERLDYCSPAVVYPPLKSLQRVDGVPVDLSMTWQGGLLDTTLLQVTKDEDALYQAMVAKAKADPAIAQEASRLKGVTIEEQAQKIIKANPAIPKDVAVKQVTRSFETGVLSYWHLVSIDDETTVMVKDILADLDKYAGAECRDPIEPDYADTGVAMIFPRSHANSSPRIQSFAHGGRSYIFQTEVVTDDPEFDCRAREIARLDTVGAGRAVAEWKQSLKAQTGVNHPIKTFRDAVILAREILKREDDRKRQEDTRRTGTSSDDQGTAEPEGDNIGPPIEFFPDDPSSRTGLKPVFGVYDSVCGYRGSSTGLPPGVYEHKVAGKGDPYDYLISAPLHIYAKTCGLEHDNHGIAVRFVDRFGHTHEFALPSKMLYGDKRLLLELFANLGLQINHDHSDRLPAYLAISEPKAELICVTRTGWVMPQTAGNDNPVFVLPHRVIGSDRIIFQSESRQAADKVPSASGCLQSWQDLVAAKAAGNPLMVLSICVALSGPLLDLLPDAESGGPHLFGGSSNGKSTCLQAAVSVWGKNLLSWRSTDNAMEGLAEQLNGTLLALDEIGQGDPKAVAQGAYMLANGVGKARMRETTSMQRQKSWKVAILSSGESRVEDYIKEGAGSAKAGQQVRLLDVRADNRTHGAFDDLHGAVNARVFADALRADTQKNFGHAGPAMVEKLIEFMVDPGIPKLISWWKDLSERMIRTRPGAGTQVQRVAKKFALIALAGELASMWRLVPWETQEAYRSALQCFTAWADEFGDGPAERTKVVNLMRKFLEEYGNNPTRFFDMCLDNAEELPRTPNAKQAGWVRREGPEATYFFHRTGLEEAVRGFRAPDAAKLLDDAGWLVSKRRGTYTSSHRVEGWPNAKSLYAIRMPEDAEAPEEDTCLRSPAVESNLKSAYH